MESVHLALDFHSINDAATHILQPVQLLPSHPSMLADMAPITHWDCVEQEGANRLRDVINKVKEMSAQI